MAFTPILLTRDPRHGPESLAEHGAYAGLTRARGMTPEAVRCEIARAELRGRGGAGFPTARKWEIAGLAPGPTKHVVANGGEHEPGSRKDRVLLATHPHKVIEGMAIAGVATGARHGYLYLIEDMTEARGACERAIAEAAAAGLLGEFEVRMVLAPPTYVAGEETAALEVIEGRPAKPRQKPPYPGESGVGGQPTTVNNVETLAHVASILSRGADWFRGFGVPNSRGSMLFTLDDSVVHPGVYELPFGATFRELIFGLGGGLKGGRELRAILPAMSCAYLPATALDLPLTHDELKRAGSSLGCGGISLLAGTDCAVCRVAAIAAFFAAEQCGQCPPCRMETTTIKAVLDKVRAGEAGEYQAQIERIAAFTARKGRCSLIEMAATPVLSALRLFPEDFAHHAATGRCPGT